MPRGHMMADVFWMQFVCVCLCVYTCAHVYKCSQTSADVSDVLCEHVFIPARAQYVFM